MTKKSYKELLRDPRWQKKRLEILSRDDFSCRNCGDSESTLHVHHCYYEKVYMPWDYPNTSLMTLCEGCHALETEHSMDAKKELSSALSSLGCMTSQFLDISDAIREADSLFFQSEPNLSAFCWMLKNERLTKEIIQKYWEALPIKDGQNG